MNIALNSIHVFPSAISRSVKLTLYATFADDNTTGTTIDASVLI